MKNKLSLLVVALAGLACVFIPSLALGQPTNDFTPDDEKIRDVLGKYSLVKIFIVPVVGALVMAVRKWVGLIPDQAWPWVTPFIGVGLDYLASKLGFWTGSVEAGAAMGGLAVWFSQLGKQTKELMVDGASVSESGDTNESSKPPKP